MGSAIPTATDPFPSHASEAVFRDPRRKTKRHQAAKTVSCGLGEVVDISSAGLRLSSKGKPPIAPGRETQIRLSHPKGDLIVAVEVRWMKRTGLFRYEMGLQFRNLTPQAEQALDSLARFGSVKATDGADGAAPLRAAVELPDYYEALGLEKGAGIEEVRTAYRQLAKRYHPDTAGASGLSCADAAAGFMRIQEAYDVLSDAEQRTTYDGRLAG